MADTILGQFKQRITRYLITAQIGVEASDITVAKTREGNFEVCVKVLDEQNCQRFSVKAAASRPSKDDDALDDYVLSARKLRQLIIESRRRHSQG